MTRVRGALRADLPAVIALAFVPVLFGIGTAVINGFGSRASINAILVLASFLGISAAGQTLVILLGGIDLSIPFVMSMGDVVAAELHQSGWPFVAVVVLVLAIAAGIGAVNGFVSARLKVPSVIITLSVGFCVVGGVEIWTHGAPTGSAPSWLTTFVSPGSHTGPIPISPLAFFWLGFSLLVLVLLMLTSYGRRLFAVGANPTAARLALVNPIRVWTLTFALSSVCAAVGGILLLGFTGSALATVGEPYLFLSIGAVVIGGTSLLGGRGGYGRTIVGAIVLTELTTILLGVGLSQSLEQVFLGVIIILAVATYGREAHIRTRT